MLNRKKAISQSIPDFFIKCKLKYFMCPLMNCYRTTLVVKTFHRITQMHFSFISISTEVVFLGKRAQRWHMPGDKCKVFLWLDLYTDPILERLMAF